jgi:hypothetical protein
MKNWIKHIIEVLSPNKWDTPKYGHDPRRVGFENRYTINNSYLGNDRSDIINAQFYVREKEGPAEVLKNRIWSRQYEIADAKRRLEEAQKRAEKALELCGVIETDIGILQDELEEMEELLTKNYPNES